MGMWGVFFFGELDKEIVKDIAKEHKLPVDKVEKAYKEMLEKLEAEKEEE